MVGVEERLRVAAQGRKKTFSVLPSWGEIYWMSDFPSFAKAPPVNGQFSRLLDKPLSSSRHVSLSVEECSRLENCVHGLVESQSYSSWAMAAVFAFLHEAGIVPEEESFHCLVSRLLVTLNSQAKASLSAAAFLKQKRRETYVSHLPSSTHESVRQVLLSLLSASSLFSDDVIAKSLGQVKDDSQILLLKNLSSQRGGKGFASSSSSLTQRRLRTQASTQDSEQSSSRSSYHSQRGGKRPASSSPRWRSPKKQSKSPAKKKMSFQK